MLATVTAHVYELCGSGCGAESSLAHRLGRTGNGHNCAVGGHSAVDVQHIGRRIGRAVTEAIGSRDYGINYGCVVAATEVGYGLDNMVHAVTVF